EKVQPQEVRAGVLVLHSSDGSTVDINCDRVIARIGNEPATKFLAACGIQTKDIAPVDDTYQSTQIPGLYMVGALAGYPLIKNCLNMGLEAVEYILGTSIPPADEPLLQEKLTPEIISVLDPGKAKMTGAELIECIRQRAPMFTELKPMHIREFLPRA